MAGSDTIALNFKVGGEADMKRALNDINNVLKSNASEMELVTAQYSKNEKSTDALSAKSKVLQNSLDNEKTKITLLKQAIVDAANAHTSAATNIDRLKNEIASATKKMDEMKSATNTSKSDLLAQQNVIKDLNKELNTSEKAYTNTGKSLTKFQTDLNKSQTAVIGLGKKLDDAKSKPKILADNLKNLGEKAKDVGEKMSLISAAIIGLGIKSIDSASDLNESQNKVETVFKNSTKAVEEFSKKTLDSYGIAQGTSLDMAALFGDMATSMGLPTQKAAEMSIKLVGLAGDLASLKNIKIDEATTALAGIFTGETESLKKLGIVMTETNLKSFALSEGIKKPFASMTEGEKVNLRFQYILGKTKNAQGDFAKTAGGTANSLRTFTESLKELSEAFGKELLPAITPIIKQLTETVKWFGSLDSGTKQFIVGIALVVAAIGPLLVALGQISIGIAAIGSSAAGAALTTIASLGGILLAVAAVAAAAYLIYENWDSISSFFSNMWNTVTQSFQNFGNYLKGQFITGFNQDMSALKEAFKATVNFLASFAAAPINAVIGLVNGLIIGLNLVVNLLNKIKINIPQFMGGGSLGFSIPNIPKIPYVSIPAYATGTSYHPGGRALVGENGPEVVELPMGSRVYPNGVNPAGGNTYIIENVTLEARTVKEINDIYKIFDNQRSRRVRG